ncbi:MAG: hypothetical protein KC933_42275, partial [Myxococcales bacterium]|nr:hypothetical protein [Myxococcales bacterium]
MSEDLPIRVAQRLREEDEALDPRLERLAMGALSPEALAELEADAARDPELARQVALFRPLSSELQDRLTEQMSAPVAKVIRPARWTRWGLPIVTLAAAALLLMTLRGPSALPSYAGRVEGGDVVLRGEPTPAAQGRRVMRGDSLLTLELSPATQVDGAVVARAYVRTPAGARAAPGVPEV